MIKKRGNKFVVTDTSGTKVLGTHPSKEKAAKQLAAIEISKAKHMHHENKSFKAFRSTLNESEYSEVLTGYGNRSAHKDGAGLHHIHSAGALNGVNAMLSTISRGTYLDPNEALLKMKVRLNVVQLDFDWRPGMLLQGVGSYDITIKQFGRVDGYDALTGQIRFDGKANPTGGYTELNLHIDVELNPDSLYVVNAKLAPAAPVVAEEVQNEEAELDEMAQTYAREREMERKGDILKAKAQRAYDRKMHSDNPRAVKQAERDEKKHDAAYDRLAKQDSKEFNSPKLYGKGGKIVKNKKTIRKNELGIVEETEQIDELSKATKDAYVAKRGSQLSSMLSGHTRGKQLTGKQQANAVKGIKKAMGVSEEAEQIDEAGQAKLERLGKAYDKARIGSRGVSNPKRKKELGDAYFSMRDKVLDKRKKRIESGTFDKEKELTARIAHNKKTYGKGDFGSLFGNKTVKEELVGGQKKLDVNKNKRLDAQDFALLRNKKKAVKEETVEEAKKFKAWTPRLDKLMANRDAVRSKPKKSILTQKVEGGKKIGAARPIADVKEEANKAKKPAPKADPHAGARTEIGKQKSIKRMLDKHGMRW